MLQYTNQMEKLNLDQFISIQQKKKTVINHKFSLKNAFQEILYMIDNWINEGSVWIVEMKDLFGLLN